MYICIRSSKCTQVKTSFIAGENGKISHLKSLHNWSTPKLKFNSRRKPLGLAQSLVRAPRGGKTAKYGRGLEALFFHWCL